MKGRGKREIPEKTRRPTASSGTIPTSENPVTQPGIEPGSPCWKASGLSARPRRPHQSVCDWSANNLAELKPSYNHERGRMGGFIEDVMVRGLSTYHVKRLAVNWTDSSANVSLVIPQVDADGFYIVNGTFAEFLPVYGEGLFRYGPFVDASDSSQALLKFYPQDIPQPQEKKTERGGAVVTRRARILEDPGSIPCPAILISVSHGFPKSFQANAGVDPQTKAMGATCTVSNDLAVDETMNIRNLELNTVLSLSYLNNYLSLDAVDLSYSVSHLESNFGGIMGGQETGDLVNEVLNEKAPQILNLLTPVVKPIALRYILNGFERLPAQGASQQERPVVVASGRHAVPGAVEEEHRPTVTPSENLHQGIRTFILDVGRTRRRESGVNSSTPQKHNDCSSAIVT
ncbi:hypothetical protein PR048_027178 [Dryococelus australis]|uniref:Uncharacterized protein n=1 Tax=Dryococelus australis TaxID=614101 RepID=A0ABQ9GEQ9_9NEOP|nr:hypothetical protein PR048_027178 [Dryococelus australis]